MRRCVQAVLVCLFLLVGMVDCAWAVPKVVIEGPGDEFPDILIGNQAAVAEDGSIFVPLRDIAIKLGYEVVWEPESMGISLQANEKQISMNIGSPVLLINLIPYDMQTAPLIMAERTMVPLSYVTQAFDYQVAYSEVWNEEGYIYITPYSLIADSELQALELNSIKQINADGDPAVLELKREGITPAGIQLTSSIKDVMQVYGLSLIPARTLNYDADWSGTLIYWGTFIPRSNCATFWEFTFEEGNLTDLTIYG